jgi:iron complex outermembrane receptor protein
VRFTPSVTGGLNPAPLGPDLLHPRPGLDRADRDLRRPGRHLRGDEIYFARQSVNAVSLFDIERVEVLRGPQGTLFGRNTPAAPSLSSPASLRRVRLLRRGLLRSFDRVVLRGSVDVPISPQLLTKVSAFRVTDEGYAKGLVTGEDLNDEDGYGVRGAVRWIPSDRLTWDIAVDYIDQARITLGAAPWIPSTRRGRPAHDRLRQQHHRDVPADLAGNCARVETGGLTSNCPTTSTRTTR